MAVTDDAVDEPDGAAAARLVQGATYRVGATEATATVTVTDNDAAPTAALAVAPASISEAGGASAVSAAFIQGASSAPTTLTVRVEPGLHGRAGDVTLSADPVLTIAPRATASTGSVTITALDNDFSSADKTFTVTAAAANAQGMGSLTAATLTITDDDTGPLQPTNLGATHGNGSVTLTWDTPPASVDSIEYRQRRAGQGYAAWTAIDASAAGGANRSGFTVAGLTNPVTYHFEIRAVSGTAYSGPSNEATATPGLGYGICDRSAAVRTALLANFKDGDCAALNAGQLASLAGEIRVSNVDPRGGTIAAGDFAGLTSLQTLEVDGGFTTIPDGVFADLAALTTLDLRDNRLTTITAAMFTGLSRLTTLDLSSSGLETLPDGAFGGLSRLTTLTSRQTDSRPCRMGRSAACRA